MISGLHARTAAIAAAVLASAIACGAPASTTAPSESPIASPTEIPFVATAIPTPRTTPPGTAAPHPSAAIAKSAEITRPPQAPGAKPTPPVDPAMWRLDGYVVDESGVPLVAACVVIGPAGCQLWSPKTDDRGYWFFDVARAHTTFDIFFERPGHKSVWWRVIPEGPIEFNVILPRG